MSSQRLNRVLLFLIPFIFVSIQPWSASDLAVWIAHGLHFLEHHSVMRQDVFSVLPTSPLVYPAFGISVFYAFLYQWFGLAGVCFFHALVILPVILYLIYRQSLFRLPEPQSGKVKLFTFVTWLGTTILFSERPSMVAIIPLLLSYEIINETEDEISTQAFLKLLALNVLWANIHGSFLVLSGMLGWNLFWKSFSRFRLKSWIQWLAILASSVLNPFGWKIFPYILETARVSKLRGISEWGAPDFSDYRVTALLFWAMFVFMIFVFQRTIKTEKTTKILSSPFYAALLLGTTSIRNSGLVFVLLLPYLTSIDFFRNEAASAPVTKPWKIRFSVAVFCILAVLSVAWVRTPLLNSFKIQGFPEFDESVTPKIAGKIRETGRTCPVFNAFELGSYLMLVNPNRIFIDTRNIIYNDEMFWDYRNALHGVHWQDFLNHYQTCFAAIPIDSQLAVEMSHSTNWKPVVAEKGYILFEKKEI